MSDDQQTPQSDEPTQIEAPLEDTTSSEVEALKQQLAEQAAQLAQLNRTKAERDAEAARQAAEAKAAHERGLAESKKYKELFQIKEKELQDSEARRKAQAEAVKTTFKLQHKREAALKAGIRDDALHLIEGFADDELELSTSESGAISVTGGEKWAENLKTANPFLFKSSTAPNLPGGRPSPQTPPGKKINLLELQRKDPEAYKAEMERRMKDSGVRIK